MVITAKFASTCPCCSARQVGSKVEWAKGSAAKHVTCAPAAGASTVTAAPASRGRSYARRSAPTGERYVKRGSCWECGAFGPLTADGECGHC
jgi:hypothetical protein